MDRIKKVNWWHEAIIDWMLAHPEERLYDCAAYFNKTQPWISSIINSSMFKELLAQRKLMHAHMISLTLTEKLESIAHKTLDALEESLEVERKKGTISVGCARDTAEMALRSLGYSSRSPAALNINVGHNSQVAIVGSASPEALASARQKMQQLQDLRERGLLTHGEESGSMPCPA